MAAPGRTGTPAVPATPEAPGSHRHGLSPLASSPGIGSESFIARHLWAWSCRTNSSSISAGRRNPEHPMASQGVEVCNVLAGQGTLWRNPRKAAGRSRSSRGRRFKSCQPDRGTASDLRKRRSEAVCNLNCRVGTGRLPVEKPASGAVQRHDWSRNRPSPERESAHGRRPEI